MDNCKDPDFWKTLSEKNLLLEASVNDEKNHSIYVEDPIWGHIEKKIEQIFSFGGTVRLHSGESSMERSQGFRIFESIVMESLPGKFRLIYSPPIISIQEKSRMKEWWEPGDTPFRGCEFFGDDEWDARTVCTDMNVAKKAFLDFFVHGEITEESGGDFLSVWDAKPRY